MNIAFFTDTYYPQLNGVTTSVENYAGELRKKGHTVYIFAPKVKKYRNNDENTTNITSLKVLSSEPPIYFPIPTSYKNYKKIFHTDLDIIHAHGNGAFSLLGYQVARMKGIPFLMTFHSLHPQYTHYFLNGILIKPKMIEKVLMLFANICDAIIAPSEKMKRELMLYGVKKPIRVLPNFVDTTQFIDSKKGFLRKKFSIPASAPILISVGRLGIEKNFTFIIDVFKKLSEKDKRSHLVIVGQGKEMTHLKNQAAELGLTRRIHFTGKVASKQMPSVYADASIFVFSSVSEVHPVAALEACAAGLPLIVSNDAAFQNMVINKVNGFLLPLKVDLFVEKISYLLENAAVRKSFGNESHLLIKEHFPPDKLTDMLLDIYYQTLAANKSKLKKLHQMNDAAIIKIKKTARVLDRIFNI